MTTTGLTRRALLGGAAAASFAPAAAGAGLLPREDDVAAGRATPAPTPAPQPSYPPLPAGARPFAPGERLAYTVDFEGFRAGEATLAVVGPAQVEDRSGLLVRYTAETRGVVAVFYKLQDRIDTLLDPLFLFTRRTETWSQQRNRSRHRIVTFDPAAGRFVRREIPGDTITGRLESPVVEGLGLVYHLRVKPLGHGARLTVPIYRRQAITAVTFEAKGPVTVDTPAGRFETFEIRPVEAAGKSTEERGLFGGDGTIWLTTDARRIPVRLAGEARAGALEARLRDVLVPPAPISSR